MEDWGVGALADNLPTGPPPAQLGTQERNLLEKVWWRDHDQDKTDAQKVYMADRLVEA